MQSDLMSRFDEPVGPGGYRWWYVDALSDCGEHGLVVIAFIGSVFSPYYFRARALGGHDPRDHCAINVALYGPRSKTWAMTERTADSLSATAERLRIGPSSLCLTANGLEVEVAERSAPFGRRVRGRVRVDLPVVSRTSFELDRAGRHRWQPIAPSARVAVEFASPAIAWSGDAYVDCNAGERPLEQDFRCWDWSRSSDAGRTRITYNVVQTDGRANSLALGFDPRGVCSTLPVPPRIRLPCTAWGIERQTRADGAAVVERTLEDTPFYSRSILRLDAGRAMHESLSLERFRKTWVRTLLPFRMPRRRWPIDAD